MIHYSETEFFAATNLVNLIETTSSSPFPTPINLTYQTDFILLSDYDSGIATKNSSVILLSSMAC